MARLSIYEFAGGDAAFLALAAAHHERCLADPELNHPFSHGVNPAHILRAYMEDAVEEVLAYGPRRRTGSEWASGPPLVLGRS